MIPDREPEPETVPTEAQKASVKQMLVQQLRLRMEPGEIEDDAPLFGEGLGLDSVDAMELISALEQRYGVIVTSEDEAKRIFESVEALTGYVVDQGGLA